MSAADNSSNLDLATWKSLPGRLKMLIFFLATMSLIILCWSGWNFDLLSHDRIWIVLFIMAILTLPFVILLPQLETLITFGEPFLMAIAVIYGTAACVVATACYGLIAFRTYNRRDVARFTCNLSVAICGAFLYSTAFHLIKPSFVFGFSDMILPGITMALVSFLFGSLLTATAVIWRRGQSASSIWIRAYTPLILIPLICAIIAIFLAASSSFNIYLPVAAAPAIAIMWGIAKTQKRRIEGLPLSLP